MSEKKKRLRGLDEHREGDTFLSITKRRREQQAAGDHLIGDYRAYRHEQKHKLADRVDSLARKMGAFIVLTGVVVALHH